MRRRTILFMLVIFVVYASSLFALHPLIEEKKIYRYSSGITFTNCGNKAQSLNTSLLTTNIFMNTTWQTAYLESINGEHSLTEDADENKAIIFTLPLLSPGRNVTISYSIRLEERIQIIPKIDYSLSGDLADIPCELKARYSGTGESWPTNEALKSLANKIWSLQGKTTNILKIAIGMADWIGKNIKSTSHDIPYYPNETYLSLEGDCDDQSNLFIALLHAMDVPAYLQVGALSWFSSTETYWNSHITSNLEGISYHAWAVVYVPPWGWLPFDIALGWSSSDSLSVVKSAKVWSLNAMPLMNVIVSDWPGAGRSLKSEVTASQLNIYYKDTLVSSEGISVLRLLVEFPYWNIIMVAMFISLFAVSIYMRRPKPFNP